MKESSVRNEKKQKSSESSHTSTLLQIFCNFNCYHNSCCLGISPCLWYFSQSLVWHFRYFRFPSLRLPLLLYLIMLILPSKLYSFFSSCWLLRSWFIENLSFSVTHRGISKLLPFRLFHQADLPDLQSTTFSTDWSTIFSSLDTGSAQDSFLNTLSLLHQFILSLLLLSCPTFCPWYNNSCSQAISRKQFLIQ